jgi:NAD(P)-dependent dehydrogenase (short-subunit alcohol dehydrogenase family)
MRPQPQHQDHQPGSEADMHPRPRAFMESYRPAGKLYGKVAIVTGGDSGIGRATSIGFAKEGADVVIVYLDEDEDALVTARRVQDEGRRCARVRGDVGDKDFCMEVVEIALQELGGLDIVVNNAGEQHEQNDIGGITSAQLYRTFETNVFGMFYMTQAALPFMHPGSCIINTASVTAYEGKPDLIDYAATKGAVVSFTRSLAASLAPRKIRVNAVAPGPVWTPLIPASFSAEKVAHFGEDVPLGGPGQPDDIAPSYIFLASDDSIFMTGQVLHPNGGTIING